MVLTMSDQDGYLCPCCDEPAAVVGHMHRLSEAEWSSWIAQAHPRHHDPRSYGRERGLRATLKAQLKADARASGAPWGKNDPRGLGRLS